MEKINKEKLIKIVKKAKRGDEKAFSYLYEYYISPIFRFIYFRIKSYEEAEDLTQAVFLKAWNALPNYQQKKNPFSSWLYTIARNTIIDYWKKRKEWKISDLARDTIKDSRRPIYDLIEEEEDFRVVKEAISLLSEDQQEVIILKFIEELSNKEIAKIMNKKEDAIRQLQSRAIKSLKEYLNKDYER
ncbi:MAG: RNA polymerase sigma factor [Patescibacteria group bacterium]